MGRLLRWGAAAALLAWLIAVANCGGSPTAPGPTLALTCPAAVQATSPDGVAATVSYDSPGATGGTAPVSVSCSPASGSSFPVGATNVSCAARDSRGRTATCAFVVTVNRPPNDAPTITALTLSAQRVEVNGTVQASVTVQDADTPPAQMQYEWTADRGTFTGQGTSVTWRAPTETATPVDAHLTVTVVETYQTVGVIGAAAEYRVSKTSDPVRVHNSPAEITSLVDTFLGDFATSSVPPGVCVRNFSDTCQGKQDELLDITTNRANYVILSSNFRVDTVSLVTPFSRATITAPCKFTSRELATGAVGTVAGNCLLTATYEQQRWWLCDSHFQGTVVPSMKSFFGIR